MAKKRNAQKGGEASAQKRGGGGSLSEASDSEAAGMGGLGMSAGGGRGKKQAADLEEPEQGHEIEGQSVFELLKMDHRKVEELFDQVEAADDAAQKQLIHQIVEELLVHMRAEEETVYSRLRDEEEFSEQILKADEEHAIVHNACRELLQADAIDERILAKVKVMKELVLHHVEEEEGQLIPTAEELIGEEAAVALGEEFSARKLTLQGEGGRRERLGATDVSKSMEMGQPSR